MRSLAANWKWLLATLLVAIAVHIATVFLLPRLVMLRTMAGLSRAAGSNHFAYAARPTARSRSVVRPSPDLFYSTCVYDLKAANGAVRVRANEMPPTYWSVSVYDADTDNFFVLNDRHAKNGAVDFLLISPGKVVGAGRLPQITAPTDRGIVLLRTLINDEARTREIDVARRHASCEPYNPSNP